MTTKLTKEERAERRAQEQAAEHAKLEADLQKTIELVTAMFWNLECGENLSREQVAAARHDHVLGCLWWRVWDYAEYMSRTHRLRRSLCGDKISLYIEYESKRAHEDCEAWMKGDKDRKWYSHEVRAIAVQGHPKARAMRQRHAKMMAQLQELARSTPASEVGELKADASTTRNAVRARS